MWRSFFTDRKWLVWSWGGAFFIFLSLLSQTWIDVQINEWYKGFYDLLQKATEKGALKSFMTISYFFIGYTLCNYLYSNKLLYENVGFQMERSNHFFVYAILEKNRCKS